MIERCPGERSSRGSAARTARCSRNCCSTRVTRWPGSPGARVGSYPNLTAISDRIELVEADLNDQGSLARALRSCRPDEVYNLASVSFVPMSWEQPVLTAELAAVGATSLLEAIREVGAPIRFYQASSSEIFGEPVESPQRESTPFNPLTPYGVAKAYAHFITRSYRHRYGMHASCGILFNHTSAAAVRRVRAAQDHCRGCRDQARADRRTCGSAICPPDATGATPTTTSAASG